MFCRQLLVVLAVVSCGIAYGTPALAQAEPPQAPPTTEPPTTGEPPAPPKTEDVQPSTIVKAPNEPPPVPEPSPVVLGGRPTPPDVVGKPLHWHASPFSIGDYIVTGTGGALTLAAAIIKPSTKHSLSGGILFDDSVRNAVRPSSIRARYNYRDASDVGLSLVATWPFFVDALATAWWYRGSRDVAQEMALLDLETLAVSGAVQGVTNVFVSRERPYGRYCDSPDLPSASTDCDGNTHYRSFFSGHSAFSFTSAALICINHFENELLGAPWDALSCAGGYAVAATTASFRVLGDVHYASDILTGALVGTIVGYGIPLLHYRHHDSFNTVTTGGMTIKIVPSGAGAGVVGVF